MNLIRLITMKYILFQTVIKFLNALKFAERPRYYIFNVWLIIHKKQNTLIYSLRIYEKAELDDR